MPLARMVVQWRVTERLTLRDAGEKIGIGYNSLRAFERGELINAETFSKILTWAITCEQPVNNPE